MVAKEGESAFLDACGVLEPNKVLVVAFLILNYLMHYLPDQVYM